MKGYLVPHPPLIVPGVGNGDEIPSTRHSYEQAAAEIEKINPETVVIISPHSVMCGDYFHIASGQKASGDFGAFRAKNIKFEVTYDEEFSNLIGELARKQNLPAGGLERKYPLDHGVMVPLYFIKARRIVQISLSMLSGLDHYRLGMCIANAAKSLGRNFVIIASGDMSHKLKADGPYGFIKDGPEFDNFVKSHIENSDILELLQADPGFCERAAECGFKSLAILLGAFDGYKVNSKVLSYEGPFGVGYLCASFESGEKLESLLPELIKSEDEKIKTARNGEDEFVKIARAGVEHFTREGKRLKCPETLSKELLNSRAGVFVSIKKDGALRGCIGTISPVENNIAEEIISNGISAAARDPRFYPVEKSELAGLIYSVDVLAPAKPIKNKDELDVNRYGVIVRCGKRSGLLLPALDGVDTVEDQIDIALKKAGISENEPYTLERFEVVRHK